MTIQGGICVVKESDQSDLKGIIPVFDNQNREVLH